MILPKFSAVAPDLSVVPSQLPDITANITLIAGLRCCRTHSRQNKTSCQKSRHHHFAFHCHFSFRPLKHAVPAKVPLSAGKIFRAAAKLFSEIRVTKTESADGVMIEA
jgi:hypothetical protein